MKANELERIYIQSFNSNEEDAIYFDDIWTEEPEPGQENIEYTRTDAFIKKAISWLKEQDEMIGVSFQKDFLERFKNYMEE